MIHTLKGKAVTRLIWLDGKPLTPYFSQKVINHSPDGFNWGYGGSGPAQLAAAVMLEITGETTGYQDFKWKTIAGLPQNQNFEIQFDLEKGVQNEMP